MPSGRRSFLWNRAAPSRQVICVNALSQGQRLFERVIEVFLHGFALKATAKKIRPDKLAERCRVLGVATRTPEFAGKRAERIVNELGHRLRNIAVVPAATIVVE